MTSDHLLAVCRAGNGIVSIQMLHFMAANAGYQLVSNVAAIGKELLSDEAVESIGRGDVVRWSNVLGILSRRNTLRKRVA